MEKIPLPLPLPEPTKPHRVNFKKYRLLFTRFKEFSERRGYVMIDQWEPPDVREFRTS